MGKKAAFIVLSLVTVLLMSTTVYALVMDVSFYNGMSWTWSYNAEATGAYNCLGYATGSMTWEWPWGAQKPSSSQVSAYLASKGYTTVSSSGNTPRIISYGWSSNITHFSLVTGTDRCRAKWGALERFNHNSWDPYYHDSDYGPQVQIYYR